MPRKRHPNEIQRKASDALHAYHRTLGDIANDIIALDCSPRAKQSLLQDVPLAGLRQAIYDRCDEVCFDEETMKELRISKRSRNELQEWLTC